MTNRTERTTTASGTAVANRFRRTSVDGCRGVVWEWTDWDRRDDASAWSEPSGPFQSMAEAREFAAEMQSFQ